VVSSNKKPLAFVQFVQIPLDVGGEIFPLREIGLLVGHIPPNRNEAIALEIGSVYGQHLGAQIVALERDQDLSFRI
jgi:hypothetical protein